MEGEIALQRVLIAHRGEIARRLIRHYAQQGVETCVVFSEADAELEYLDEADYASFLNGRTVEETYLNPARVVSAAMDAGCDAIHPGTGLLAEDIDLYDLAHRSNIAVIGADPRALPLVTDRVQLRAIATQLQLPLIPTSEVLSLDHDGMAAAARIGAPLFIRAVQGGAVRRVEDLTDLPDALAEVRQAAQETDPKGAVYLERAVDAMREIGSVIAADRLGGCIHLGETDSSLRLHGQTWVEEAGSGVVPDLRQTLGEAAIQLARAVRWAGMGKVRWALTPNGGWFLLGFSARLTTGFDLLEQVHDVDLLQAQFTSLSGQPLRWDAAGAIPDQHGIQLRILHIDPIQGTRPEGVLERLEIPHGVIATRGVEPGTPCSEDTDPLLLKLNFTAPTRHAAVVKAKAALDELVVEGVQTNLAVLREVVGLQRFWDGEHDVRTLASRVRGGGR